MAQVEREEHESERQVTWRESSKSHIAKVVRDNPGADTATMRGLLRKAYPFGLRKHFPYKVWCEEVANQLGTRKVKAATVQDVAADLFTKANGHE